MPPTHHDLLDTRHVKSELAARAMPEGKVFLYLLAITTFDWLQLTAFRIRPNPEPLSASAQFEAWFGFGITSAPFKSVLRRSFLRRGEFMDQALWVILAEDWVRSKVVWG